MSFAQTNEKNHKRQLIYGSVLVLIIALSAAVAFLFTSNQSLRNDMTKSSLISLAQYADDAHRRIELFVGTYYDQLIWHLRIALDSTSETDNLARYQAVADFLSTLTACAEQTYYDFKNDVGRINGLTNFVNRTAYDNITETVRVAMGQIVEIGIGKPGFVVQVDGPPLINQTFAVIGVDKETQSPDSGLRGIAWNFIEMSTYWYSQEGNQGTNWLPTPQVSLSFALANATELYVTMSAWGNFTSNPNLGQ